MYHICLIIRQLIGGLRIGACRHEGTTSQAAVTMLGILLAYLDVLKRMTKLLKELIKEQNDLFNLEPVTDDGGVLRPAWHQGRLELWEH